MAINDHFRAATASSLDSDAFFDGAPVSSHVLRVMAHNANRLLAKESQMFQMCWPIYETAPSAGGPVQRRYDYHDSVSLTWYAIVPPFRIDKKPGSRKMEAKVLVSVVSGSRILLQVSTLATPFAANEGANSKNVVQYSSASDAFTTISFSDIDIDPGHSEHIGLWARAVDLEGLVDTAAYGAPNSGSIQTLDIRRLGFTAVVGWGTGTAGITPGQAGAIVVMKDSNGEVIAIRKVNDTGYFSPTGSGPVASITWDVPLTDDQIQHLMSSGSSTWELHDAPVYTLGAFSGITKARTV